MAFFFFIPFQEEAERVLPLYNLMINNSKKIIEIYLIYNVVLVLGVQQNDSIIHTCILIYI